MDDTVVQPPAPPLQPPVPAPPKPKNYSNILIAILLVVIGFLVSMELGEPPLVSNLRSKYLGAKPTSTSLASPTEEAVDPTVNWKTYTNPTQTYSFKYPDGLKSDTGAAGVGFESIRFSLMGPTQTASGRTQTELFDGYSFSVAKLGPKLQKDPKTESEKQARSSKEICPDVSPISNVVIAGINAFQYSGSCLGSYTAAYLSDGKDTYSIIQLYTNDSYKTITDHILSTFKFIEQSPTVPPTPTVPPNWIRHTFNTYGLIMYTPDDWQSSITDFPENSESLVKFWKKSSPTIIPIQLAIKPNWDNTGYDPSQAKHAVVDGNISAIRVDPPTKTQQTAERYQTNVYFEHNTKIYVFTCVHNWTQDYLDTCNTMLETLQFTK